jgi:hypothetical protein
MPFEVDHLGFHFEAIDGDVSAALSLLEETADTLYKRSVNRIRPRLPLVIVGELCLHLYLKEISQPYHAFQLSDWPPVVYHHDIDAWLRRLIHRLFMDHGQACVNISVKRTAAFFEIALTQPDLHLRPDTWARLIERGGYDNLEFLHELMGHVEPLTWDEGWGEGVIVRLPWAEVS